MIDRTCLLLCLLAFFAQCTSSVQQPPPPAQPTASFDDAVSADAPGAADSLIVREDLSKHLKACNEHLEGSITIYDQQRGKWIISDSAEIYREALPASTFKIINLLIALEEGLVRDENEVMIWTGETDTTLYGNRPEISRDLTVKEAFELSAVWVFLDLAKKIGKDRYAYYLKATGYGNGNLEQEGEDFWNFGSFGVSPLEQVQFLRNVYEGKSPFSKRSTDILKKVMLTEETADYKIRAKTGWTREGGMNLGWWVGYAETEQGVYFFATRLYQDRKFNSPSFGPCRKDVTRAMLRELEIIR
ncbi:penicillin-binding transpeptidase domain-containing protein [Cesiribacter sp. SM1]|uniref:penicillin-binding transpeptidase domain-containing protein n=1 Tax=Cesiribacter sp. SM1 TaxID=2861196 RepID=UPI001CD4673F|nr:penicillin-binding transpeptidase domain-containing protein [Cesiribacter sp. SM1]